MTLQRLGTIAMKGQADVDGILKPGEQIGGTLEYREFLQSVDLGSVATIAAENEDMTITGVAVGDMVLFANPAETLVANIIVAVLGPVVTANVVRFRVANPTAAAIDAAAVNFRVGVLRPPAPAV